MANSLVRSFSGRFTPSRKSSAHAPVPDPGSEETTPASTPGSSISRGRSIIRMFRHVSRKGSECSEKIEVTTPNADTASLRSFRSLDLPPAPASTMQVHGEKKRPLLSDLNPPIIPPSRKAARPLSAPVTRDMLMLIEDTYRNPNDLVVVRDLDGGKGQQVASCVVM